MKLEGFRESRTGNHEIIGVFAFGEKEAEVLAELANLSKRHTPTTSENNIYASRIRNVARSLNYALLHWGKSETNDHAKEHHTVCDSGQGVSGKEVDKSPTQPTKHEHCYDDLKGVKGVTSNMATVEICSCGALNINDVWYIKDPNQDKE